MKISLNWARNWTDVPGFDSDSLDKFSHTYSTYTAEVEGIDTYIFDDKIVVGKVLAWKPHPDSDKLGLVQIDAGKCGQHEIVCGAANAKTAKYVPVALENAVLPGGLVIARRPIRGIDSCGMICSLDELSLQSDRSGGIFPLETVWDEEALSKHLGQSFGTLTLTIPGYGKEIEYAMSDVVFDLDNKFITNRPDLFSVVGNAREISCINKKALSATPFGEIQSMKSKNDLPVKNESDKVINYLLTEYTLPSLPESPFLIQTLLRRSNQGSHGLLPDLTNIVMTEIGQPMHVFDADTIKGQIVLRMARKDEKFLGLDDKEYTLSSEDLVIVDDEKVLSIAGIMGGKSSGASENTRRIFVESATFDPVTVRKTSQRLGIRTDSSMRFEKGVDLTLPLVAQARYKTLLSHYVPGVESVKSFNHSASYSPTLLEISHDQIQNKIGTEVTLDNASTILTNLGFEVTMNKKENSIIVTVPSWRNTGDVAIPEDIIEEIARHIGYSNIPSAPLPGPLQTTHVDAHDILTNNITGFFANRGFFDAYTYPFTLAERFSRFSSATPSEVVNTSENRTHLRAHLAENLLELVANNYRSHDEGAFFEFGNTFDGDEKLQGLGVQWGKSLESLQEDLRSYMITFFGTEGVIQQSNTETPLFSPNACGEIADDSGEVIVRFGLVRPTLLPLFGIDNLEIFAFEIVKFPELHRKMRFSALSEFPGTRREFNFIMPESTPVASIIDLVGKAHDWISDITINEIYRDEGHIGKDKKSVVVSLLIRKPDATITDEEAGEVQKLVVQKGTEAGYPIRGA